MVGEEKVKVDKVQQFKLGSELPSNTKTTYAGLVIVVIAFMLFFGLYGFSRKQNKELPGTTSPRDKKVEVKKFSSEEEFKEYLQNAKNSTYYSSGFSGLQTELRTSDKTMQLSPGANVGDIAQGTPGVERYSQTNVQVAGIDEPDIVKTDGKNIFYSGTSYSIWERSGPIPMRLEDSVFSTEPVVSQSDQKMIAPDYYPKQTVKVVSAFPPSELKKSAEIEGRGEMLLFGKTLAVFTYNRIVAYDVTDTAKPLQKWTVDLEEEGNNQFLASRAKDGKIYVIVKSYINEFLPCTYPIVKGAVQIRCTDIYRPSYLSQTDSMITAMLIDPIDGSVDEKVTFMGSFGNSVVYMSPENLFITYSLNTDLSEFIYKFLKESASDLVPSDVLTKIEKIRSYEISNDSKMNEVTRLLENWQASLGKDEKLKIENEIQNRMNDYVKSHARELELTGIVKIDLNRFEVVSTGSVSGSPLNQFSLDEYNNNLRIATTTGNFFGVGLRNSESFSDVYVLYKNLNKIGEVLDLGKSERIYSARFIENKGYIVTFRQTDPFYVIDLSDVKNPKKAGELKIPGFSSYLHPLKDDLILGVGQENSQVKLSVFDVSNTENPTEIYKYNLNDGWSEVQNNHHAFLNDAKNQLFFVPGGLGGYVFSYKNNLSLEKTFAGYSVRRAIYINNYFYVIGDDEITVYNQSDWTSVNSLKFN